LGARRVGRIHHVPHVTAHDGVRRLGRIDDTAHVAAELSHPGRPPAIARTRGIGNPGVGGWIEIHGARRLTGSGVKIWLSHDKPPAKWNRLVRIVPRYRVTITRCVRL